MFIENGISGIAGLLDLAIVPIKRAMVGSAKRRPEPKPCVARKIALMEEAGGVSVEKLILSGEPSAVQSKAVEMIKAGRKMVLEGFPLAEIVAWCFKHNYCWRFHNDSCSKNTFILEPRKDFRSGAEEAGAKS